MGNLTNSCMKAQNVDNMPNKKKGAPNSGAAVKVENSRVNDQDRAILDVKTRLKKLKVYVDKLNLDVGKQQQKISEYLKEKNKQRALIALKHKKFIEKELDKAMGAQVLLEETIKNIESAQMDVNIYEAMKQGDQVLSELQKQATKENFEELVDRLQDAQAQKDAEAEFFGALLNEDELQDELDKLDALIAEEAIPEPGKGIIDVPRREPIQQEHVQPAQPAK